jgi:hypothetical protein
VADEAAVCFNLRLLAMLTALFSLPDLGQGLAVLAREHGWSARLRRVRGSAGRLGVGGSVAPGTALCGRASADHGGCGGLLPGDEIWPGRLAPASNSSTIVCLNCGLYRCVPMSSVPLLHPQPTRRYEDQQWSALGSAVFNRRCAPARLGGRDPRVERRRSRRHRHIAPTRCCVLKGATAQGHRGRRGRRKKEATAPRCILEHLRRTRPRMLPPGTVVSPRCALRISATSTCSS